MPTLHSHLAAALLALATAALPTARADDGLFHLDTSVAGVQTSNSYASVEDAFDALKGSNLHSLNPAYTGTQSAIVSIDYRGVALTASYVATGGSTLVLSIPSIGLSHTFDGGTRDATQQLLKNYFKQNDEDILGRLGHDLAKHSPVDPIAGNPNSLMSQLVASDFAAGFVDTLSTANRGPAINLGSIDPRYSHLREGGIINNAVMLPLAWSIRSDDDPRRQFTIRVPLAASDTDGSKSYYAGLGASLGLPVTGHWTLTPALDYAASGSRDLGSLAGVGSVSLTSAYLLPFDAFDVAIGDMVGYYRALRIKSGDYGYDPDIRNTVIRNGVIVAQPTALFGRRVDLHYSLTDTHFFGDPLYARHYDEIGVSAGTDARAASPSRGDLRAGVSFLFSPKVKGFDVSMRWRF